MSLKVRFSIFGLVMLIVVALVIWTIWLRPKNVVAPVAQDQPQILTSQDYQTQVSQVLSELLRESETSMNQKLTASLDTLQPLTVTSDVKYDHLLLFTALDLWRAENLTIDKKNSIRTKLQTFASHQPWSQAMIDDLIIKGNLTI